jgi:hypothetical protein
MTTQVFDLGDYVQCDVCGVDYTISRAVGGILFGSSGCCPECTERMMPDIVKYGEEAYIKDKAREGETFKDFCLRCRNNNNMVTIATWPLEPGDSGPDTELELFCVELIPGHEGDVRSEPFYVELYAANEDDAREQAGRKHYFATVENVERV